MIYVHLVVALRVCRFRFRLLVFDAAPYLTATLCITKDPDTGIRNVGTYRACLKKDGPPSGFACRRGSAERGGYIHWCKYRDRKERMPCAIVIGAAPVIFLHGSTEACYRSG